MLQISYFLLRKACPFSSSAHTSLVQRYYGSGKLGGQVDTKYHPKRKTLHYMEKEESVTLPTSAGAWCKLLVEGTYPHLYAYLRAPSDNALEELRKDANNVSLLEAWGVPSLYAQRVIMGQKEPVRVKLGVFYFCHFLLFPPPLVP
jgi:hypothetical protein